MFTSYFKIARRSLAANKGYTFINILGLAIGLSLCFTIYLAAGFELSFDSFHPGKERIYRFVSNFERADGQVDYQSMVPDPLAPAIKSSFTGIEAITQFHNFYTKVSVPVRGGTKIFDAPKEKENPSGIILAGPEYFAIFHYQWLAGNAGGLVQPRHVVLTASQAKKYFGSLPYSQLTGRELVYSDSLNCIVTGIVQDNPANSSLVFTDFISASTIPGTFLKNTYELDNWQNWAGKSQTFVKLREGILPAQVEQQSILILKKYVAPDPSQKTVIHLQPLADMHFDTRYHDRYSAVISHTVLYILMVIAAFVLLIAIANFINLSIAQSIKRAKETGIRKVLGSSRRSLVIQFLLEALFVTVLSAIAGVLLTPAIFGFLRPFMPGQIPLQVNALTVLFAMAVIILTALLAGIYPAKIMSALTPAQGIKGIMQHQGTRGNYLRQGLVIFQFTLSILLISGAVIMGRQVHYTLAADMGFAKEAIINIPVNPAYGTGKITAFAQLLRRQGNAEAVSVSMGTPFQNKFRGTSLQCPATGVNSIEAQFQTGDENYITLYKMKLVAGRNVQPSDTMREFIINETCAKKLGFATPADAIGKMLHAGTTDGANTDKLFPVVGVVADFHAQSLHETIAPLFISTSQQFSGTVSVRLPLQAYRLAQWQGSIAGMQRLWKTVYPEENFRWSFFEDNISNFYQKEIQAANLVNAAMALAILISCLGLLGLAAYITGQRKKEISIRKVLGASSAKIVSMLSAMILKPVAIGVLMACPLAWLIMHAWLQNFAYHVSISWWVFAAAGFAGLLMALAAISYQAIKAAIANPVKSLRS